MSTKVWEVKMTDSSKGNNVTETYNVNAETLLEAVDIAVDLEIKAAAEASEGEDEKIEPDVPRSVELLCYVDG